MKKTYQIIAGITAMLLMGTPVSCFAEDAAASDPAQTEATAVESTAETGEHAQGQVETEKLAPQVNVLAAIEGMEPVTGEMLKDGMYPISVLSSSTMFTIEDCVLMVEDGAMTARMTMGGTGYLYLYMGTGEEAVNEPVDAYIDFEEDAQGKHTFTVPVEALEQAVDCAAFSKKKEKWYDRTLVFSSADLPDEAFEEGVLKTVDSLALADGSYRIEVTLGSEKAQAKVDSPAVLTIADGQATARIIFSSGKYDYVLVNGEKYEAEEASEKPAFELPVSTLDRKLPILADSTVMIPSTEISYTLTFDSASIEPAE